MKIESIPTFVETSSNFESHQFGIDDLSMIFEILRSKLYSNPIGSIAREISCNARDAHREVGKEDHPIEIHLPSRLEPTFEVRDFGPGISKERMANVFVKYTASTKRSDNFQNGGFGLGAKTPFSYTDSFTIVTCVDGVKSTYAAYIDETRVGKVDLLSEINTDEPNGTRIIVPVRPEDFNNFKYEVMSNLYFWKVKPVIKGISPAPEFNTNAGLEILVAGSNWELWKTNNSYSYNYNSNYQDTSSAVILIDDIPYRIKSSDIGINYDKDNAKYRSLLERRLRIYFNIGELTLSANREHIHFDEKTQSLIKDRLKLIIDSICAEAQSKINNCTCLSDAEIMLNEINAGFANIIDDNKSFVWNNIPLKGIVINKIPNLQHAKIMNFSFSKNRRGVFTLNQEQSSKLLLSKEIPIYIHDLDNDHMPIQRIKKFLEENKSTIKAVQVVKFNNASVQSEWDKSFNFNMLTWHLLSSMPLPEKAKKTKSSNPIIRSEIFKFNSYSYRQSDYWKDYTVEEATKEAGDDKIIYVILKDKRSGIWSTSEEIPAEFCTNDNLKTVIRYFDKEIIGVREKDLKKLSSDSFISLGEFLQEKFIEYASDSNIEAAFSAKEHSSYTFSSKYYRMYNALVRRISEIKNQDSILLKYIKESKEIEKMVKDDSSNNYLSKIEFLTLCQKKLFTENCDFKISDHSIKNTMLEYKKKYPMLSLVDEYDLQSHNIDTIIDYVNIMDTASTV